MAHEPAEARSAAPRKASTFQLVFMTYSVICSGAYGLEQMVSASGPGMTMLTLVVLPFIWAVPVAMSCAELSARFPVEGGYYRWARMAFGDFTGYMAGWLVWLANLATNGTFAVAFANYLRYWLPLSEATHWLVALALVWVTVYMNHRGIRLVGSASVVFTLLIFVPFLAMTLAGLLHFRFNPVVPFTNPARGPLSAFNAGLLIAIWLYSGFEKLTTNAAEVENPSRAFPIALAFAVPMTAGSYIIPTFAALAAKGDWSHWGESYFTAAAQAIGGPLLGTAMAAGGLVSFACLLLVTTLGQSRLPMVMAEDGLFPAVFRKTHPRFGTPTISLIVGGIALSGLSWLSFADLAGWFSLVQVLAYLLIYASLFRLRRHPPLPGTSGAGKTNGVAPEERRGGAARDPRDCGGTAARSFRIPLGMRALSIITIPSVVLAFLVIVQSVWHDGAFDAPKAVGTLLVLASGPATYFILRRR